jgi:glycosyltransferase involved in cell wall biosynthesis
MRILVDARHLSHKPLSGVGEYTKQLLSTLFAQAPTDEFVLFTSGKKPLNLDDYFLDTQREHYRHLHNNTPNKLLKLKTVLRQVPSIEKLANTTADLVFLPNLNYTVLPKFVPSVLTVHDLSWHLFPHFYSQRMRFWHTFLRPRTLIKQATHLIVPSENTKHDIVKTFNKSQRAISVIPHGVPRNFFPESIPHDLYVKQHHRLPDRFVLYMGTLEPRKNLLAVIDAVASYRKKTNDDVKLVLAGGWGWNNGELKKRLKRHDAKRFVQQLGYVNADDRASLYRLSILSMWPSLYEGFGLPVLESMACGTPVITSRTSSLPEVVGDAALMVDPYQPQDLAAILHEALRSPTLLAELKDRGLARAEQFSWETAAAETLKVFEELA